MLGSALRAAPMRRAICSGSLPPADWRRNAPAVAAAAIASRSARAAETGTGAGAPTALVAPAAEAGATPGPIDVAAGAVAPGGAQGCCGWRRGRRSEWHGRSRRSAGAWGSAGRGWRRSGVPDRCAGGSALGGGAGASGTGAGAGGGVGAIGCAASGVLASCCGQRRGLRWEASGLTTGGGPRRIRSGCAGASGGGLNRRGAPRSLCLHPTMTRANWGC